MIQLLHKVNTYIQNDLTILPGLSFEQAPQNQATLVQPSQALNNKLYQPYSSFFPCLSLQPHQCKQHEVKDSCKKLLIQKCSQLLTRIIRLVQE